MSTLRLLKLRRPTGGKHADKTPSLRVMIFTNLMDPSLVIITIYQVVLNMPGVERTAIKVKYVHFTMLIHSV